MNKKKSKKPTPTTLADVLGIVQKSPYEVTDLKSYQEQLSKMNLLELQEHAITVGLRPSHDRALVEKTLINLFKSKHNELYALLDSKNLKTKAPKTIYDILEKQAKKNKKLGK